MIRRLRARKRAEFLTMFGLLFVLVGANLLFADALPRFEHVPVVGQALDSPLWGVVWIVGGLVALVVALSGTRRDHPGFVALLVPSGLWTLFYLAAVGAWLFGAGGRPATVSGVLAYAFVWSVVMLTAGWPNPPAELVDRR